MVGENGEELDVDIGSGIETPLFFGIIPRTLGSQSSVIVSLIFVLLEGKRGDKHGILHQQ